MSADFKSGNGPKETGLIALAFLARVPGTSVFPIAAGKKHPPLIGDNLNAASNDPKQIEAWAERWRGCNWGLALAKSGIVVMDVDTKQGKIGRATLYNLTLEHGELPETYTVTSPSGGQHYYFVGKHVFALGKNGFGTDIDSPNYVLLPGCTLASGGSYKITKAIVVAAAPAWFSEYLKPKADRTEARTTATDQIPAVELDTPANVARMTRYLTEGAPPSIQNRGGDQTLFGVICVLKDNGISRDKAIELLERFYNVPPARDPLDPDSGAIDPKSPPYCDPLWAVGNGPDADRLDVKVRNVFEYARENAPGSGTAEAAFANADEVTPDEIAALANHWKKFDRARAKRRSVTTIDGITFPVVRTPPRKRTVRNRSTP